MFLKYIILSGMIAFFLASNLLLYLLLLLLLLLLFLSLLSHLSGKLGEASEIYLCS